MMEMHKSQSNKYQDGFTLMEILISMSIITIIMVIILQAFSLSNKAWQVGEKRVDDFQRTRIIMDQINRELRGAYPFTFFQNSDEFEYEDCLGNIEFIGETDRMSFVTAEKSLSTPDSDFGFRAVTYYIDDDSGTDEEGLVVMENIPWSPSPFEEGHVVELDSSVVDIRFEYYICLDDDLSGTESVEECDWIDVWNPCEDSDMDLEMEEFKKVRTSLPKAVKITMTVRRDKKSAGGFEQYEDEELTPIVIPVYSEAIRLGGPFGTSSSQGTSLADMLPKSGQGVMPASGGNTSSLGGGGALLSPHKDDPQRSAEILRQLLSGEMSPNSR
jgi:general secretion pathway protein J